MKQDKAREILQSLPSLYPFKEYEEEAILTVLKHENLKLLYKNCGDRDNEYCCPNCGYELASGNFCCECGQPLSND